ncbi:unnamed protein product [Phytophthora fragariaefolia]|uniref:Unnamed protein product n=1 Tax=Phytophthora fragariaefolia TaxID=1490495 RepID=A0A9W7CSW6_9STRA|nr:unnamed protein product [Phytophthora fragariaefolia]
MLAARRMASGMSRDVNGVVSGTALHDIEQLHTLVNGASGDVDGDVNLGAVPTLAALLELDEMSFDKFGEALQAGELAEVVVIRPEEELNASSLLDEAVLEDAKRRSMRVADRRSLRFRRIPSTLKTGSTRTWSLRSRPRGSLPIEAFAIRLIWFRGPSTVSHDSGPYQGNSVTSLTHSSVPSTRRVWCVSASLRTRHLPSVSGSLMASGASCMLLISLMPPPFRLRHQFLGRMFFRTKWWAVRCTVPST